MSQPCLHDEIRDILIANGNAWMTSSEIAASVNERSLYRNRKGDIPTIKSNQIRARIRRSTYSHMFETARTVRLSSDGLSSDE